LPVCAMLISPSNPLAGVTKIMTENAGGDLAQAVARLDPVGPADAHGAARSVLWYCRKGWSEFC
jgi:hypothetical protein